MNQIQSNRLETLLGALFSRINYERQTKSGSEHFKLQNMRRFLQLLGNPHLKYPIIHVAGTKGKGSVTTLIGQILHCSGYRTGVYVSPHLESINQRMKVGEELISDEELEEVLGDIEPIANSLDQDLVDEGNSKLTFFEILTAAAFLYFQRKKVDVVVLEVGLGGRLDSTNVCQPQVCVITNISLDHTRQLGSTIDKIAAEKAGIIKPGRPVISGVVKPLAAEVIDSVAKEQGALLSKLSQDFQFALTPESDAFDVRGSIESAKDHQKYLFEIDNLKVSLLGKHQISNAALAVAAIQSLRAEGWKISDDQIRDGLQSARLPGRIEIVSDNPLVVLDIAHNVASVKAFVETVTELPIWNTAAQKTLLFAASSDKDVRGILRILIPQFGKIVLTKFSNNPRSKSTEDMLAIANELCDTLEAEKTNFSRPTIGIHESLQAAWANVTQELKPDETVCIAGSVFLIAEIRPLAVKWNYFQPPNEDVQKRESPERV